FFFSSRRLHTMSKRDWSSDVCSSDLVMYPAIIMFALGLAVISQASLTMAFLIAAALIGFGYGNIQSVTQALAIKVTPPERLGLRSEERSVGKECRSKLCT